MFLDAGAQAVIGQRKHIEPAEGKDQEHFRRPAADAVYRQQAGDNVFIRERQQLLEVEIAPAAVSGKITQVLTQVGQSVEALLGDLGIDHDARGLHVIGAHSRPDRLVERGPVKDAGEDLVHAVAGGVGTAAVEIGKILGMEMYGTSSSDEKLARVKELGLQHGINYKRLDYEGAIKDITHGEGVDAVFEMLGGEHTAKSTRCLRDFGRVIIYGSATGKQAQLDTHALYAKGTSIHGLWLTYLSAKRDLMAEAWKQLSQWIKQGKLHPIVGHVLPLERAAEAYRLLLERKNFGKVVLKI